jgi:hypothetical protein
MKVLQTATKTVFALLCLSPFIFFALIGFVLYKIKYGPVPPVPQLKIEYSIEDRMSATGYNVLRYYYDSNPLCAGRVLTNDGRIVQLGKADPGATMKIAKRHAKQTARFPASSKQKIPQTPIRSMFQRLIAPETLSHNKPATTSIAGC